MLDLSHNKIESLPDSICNLMQLESLQIQGLNKLQSICLESEEFHIIGNKIKKLPGQIGKLRKLQKLNISDNRIMHLPNSFCLLTELIDFCCDCHTMVEPPSGLN